MSLATIDRAPISAVAAAPTATATPKARLRPVPTGTEARGFALYVGLDEFAAVTGEGGVVHRDGEHLAALGGE